MEKRRMYERDGYISPYWFDLPMGEEDPYSEDMYVFNLFNGRHEMPLNAPAIFESATMEMGTLELQAHIALGGCQKGSTVCVYVTGFTPATVAVINVCHRLDLDLILAHYDKDTGDYMAQWVY